MESTKVVKPKCTTVVLGAVSREGADEEGVVRTFIDTPNVGDQRWEPPLADADWHAFCQTICQGVEETRVKSHVSPLQGPAPGGEKTRSLEIT